MSVDDWATAGLVGLNELNMHNVMTMAMTAPGAIVRVRRGMNPCI